MIIPFFIPVDLLDDYSSHEPKYKYSEKLVTSKYKKEYVLTFKRKPCPKGFWNKLNYILTNDEDIVHIGFHISIYDIEEYKNDFIKYIKDDHYYFVQKTLWEDYIGDLTSEYLKKEDIDYIFENYDLIKIHDCGFVKFWERDTSKRDVYS